MQYLRLIPQLSGYIEFTPQKGHNCMYFTGCSFFRETTCKFQLDNSPVQESLRNRQLTGISVTINL